MSSPAAPILLLESINSNNLLNFRGCGCVSRWQVETFGPNSEEASTGTDSCVHGTTWAWCNNKVCSEACAALFAGSASETSDFAG